MDQKDVSVQLDETDVLLSSDNIVLDKIAITWENIQVKKQHTNPALNSLRAKFDKNFIPQKEIIKNSELNRTS